MERITACANMDEIVVYQPNNTLRLEVHVHNESVWLTQAQLCELFGVVKSNISYHLKNIFKTNELEHDRTVQKIRTVQNEGGRTVTRTSEFYNLEVIISLGFRVNSRLGIQFRRWANEVLKRYMTNGMVMHPQVQSLAHEMDRRLASHDRRITELEDKVDFFVKSSIPAPEQVFVNGQFLDAHVEFLKIIRSAKKRLVLVDNFIDERVFTLLAERDAKVSCTIYSRGANKQDVQLSATRYAQQYPNKPISMIQTSRSHDRFLVVDDQLWHIGASPKDAGARIFALMKMELHPDVILGLLP